ncbi:MAG: M14 family zinc carboxypeptidase [Candidatus Hodarchaeota archaeon]
MMFCKTRWGILGLLLVLFFPYMLFGCTARINVDEPVKLVVSADRSTPLRTWSALSLLYPDQYHNYSQLVEELNQIANNAPDIVEMYTIGQSLQGKDIHCLRITNEENSDPKAGVLFVAHHHAREQITVEIALRFLLRLVNNYGIDQAITEYVNHEDIYIIPSLNPDSLYYVVEEGDSWLRKNLKSFDDDNDGFFDEDPADDVNGDGIVSEFSIYIKNDSDWIYGSSYFEGIDNDGDGLINEDPVGGVDLNRNYNFRWNDSSLDTGWGTDTTSMSYPGTAPFSEPETQVFRDFMSDKVFSTAISLHSGINATYFPWASVDYFAEPSLYYQIYSDFLGLVPNLNDYLNISASQEEIQSYYLPSYTSAGSWDDWMYYVKKCLVPLTYEIYHNGTADNDGILRADLSNETYQVWQWDHIFEYFAPYESAIAALWNDIQPAFDYWLSITPRLNITGYVVLDDENTGNRRKLEVIVENLSPRVETTLWLNLVNNDFDYVLKDGVPVTIRRLIEGQIINKTLEFDLDNVLQPGTEIILKIGNDYVGYSTLSIDKAAIGIDAETNKGNEIPWDLLAMLSAIPIMIGWIKIKGR